MARLDKWESKHLKDVERYAQQIDAIYQSAVREAAAIGATIPNFSPDTPFSFADYPSTRVRVQKLIDGLKKGVQTVVLNGVDAEWMLANNKNNEIINDTFAKLQEKIYANVSEIPEELFKGIKNYTDTTYRFVSRYIRDGVIINPEKHQRTIDTIEKLDNIFSNTKLSKGTYYRGISLKENEYAKLVSELKSGVYTEKSFASMSKDIDVARSFTYGKNSVIMEISGSGLDLEGNTYYDEKEVLANRNVKYNVKGITQDGDITYIKLEEAITPQQQVLPETQRKAIFNHNSKACDAFKARKTAGLGLSDRVWNYTSQFKTEIEMGLDLGLRDGLSADEMSRDLRQYLKYPDKLFRRVRDEHGQLHLSQAAKAFNPGQGVYRSSYKNAMRLARTETNMAYRTSDYTRWQQLDFVVGIEIRTSNNHPIADICDELAGRYPKDFKFTGWHPQCRCHAVTILKTPEEMEADNERIMNGEELNGESVNRVDDVPQQFKQWTTDNEKRLTTAKSIPYFISENSKYTGVTLKKGI